MLLHYDNEPSYNRGLKALQNTIPLIAFCEKDLIYRCANQAHIHGFGIAPESMIDKMHLGDLPESLYEKNFAHIEGIGGILMKTENNREYIAHLMAMNSS